MLIADLLLVGGRGLGKKRLPGDGWIAMSGVAKKVSSRLYSDERRERPIATASAYLGLS